MLKALNKDKDSVQESCVVTGMDSARWCMETHFRGCEVCGETS